MTDARFKRVLVLGHRGMVGSAICRKIRTDWPFAEIVTRTRDECDLVRQSDVESLFRSEQFDLVVLAAARVGGIVANDTYPADFIYDNLMMEANVIQAAHSADVQNLLFLGSSCIYPKMADQPMQEDALLTGTLEPTNEPYAIAKIAGIKLCESYNRQHGRDYRSAMPTNLYGPHDNFHPQNSHVIPGLIRRFHEAKQAGMAEVVVWGTGSPMREFLYVDDMASACLHIAALSPEDYAAQTDPRLSHINVGTGQDVTIKELAETIADTVGFAGQITFDTSKPDGTPRKLMDVSRLQNMGWSPEVALKEGLQRSYSWFLENAETRRD